MIRSTHRLTCAMALLCCAVLLASGCAGDREGSSGTRVDRSEPEPAAPLRPAELTTVATFDPGGSKPISTEIEQVGPKTWLLTYGTETRTANLDSYVAISRDDGASWTQLETGRSFTTKGPDGFNAISSLGDTWVIGGVWGADTPADDPYLPAAWWSEDEGASWTRVVLPVLPRQNGIVNDMVRWKDAIYAVGQFQPDEGRAPRTGAIWRSEDGRTWEIVGSGPAFSGNGKEVYLMSVAAHRDGLVVAGSVSRSGDAEAGSDSTPAVWTSSDGIAWGERMDLERPRAQVSDVSIGGADGDQVVLSGRSDLNRRDAPWFEVGTLVTSGDRFEVEISREQALRSTDPRTFSRGVRAPGGGIVRGMAWNAGQWVAVVVPPVEGTAPATLWRSADAQEFTPLGPQNTQPAFEPRTYDALGDLELRDGLLLTSGRVTGTTRITVLRGSST